MSKAVTIHEVGGPEVLKFETVDVGDPGPGEVLLRQSAAGLNFIDTYQRTGLYPLPSLPAVLGMEGAGVVEAVGVGVTEVDIGDRVAYSMAPGAYAERRLVPAAVLVRLPDGISDDQGAAMMLKGCTAQYLIRRTYRIEAGDMILIHAAAGGVGLIVCQWAKHLGATVIGTVGTSGKEEKPLAYGATQVINLKEGNFAEQVLDLTQGKGVDLAIDSLGATTLDKTFSAVRMLGHLINIGEAEGQPIENIRQRCLVRSQTFTRFHLGHVMEIPSLWKDGNDFVLDALIAGWLDPTIVEIFPLEQARQMHERIEDRSNSGKLLLQADPSAAIG